MSTRVAVIGAGPGGYAAAFHAADKGMKVTLVAADPNPGGVCTFRGCIPSKPLLHAAKVIESATHAEAFGMSFGRPSIDIAKLRRWKDAVVTKQTSGLGLLAKSRKVEFIQGRASIVDARTLSVDTSGGERKLETDYIIIATGSRPLLCPAFPSTAPTCSTRRRRSMCRTYRGACSSSAEGISGSSSEPCTPRSDPK